MHKTSISTRSSDPPPPAKDAHLDAPNYELENFAVVQHPIRGLEVITLRPVKRNTTILEYKGDLITRTDANEIESECLKNNIDCDKLLDFPASGDKRLCINALAPSPSLGRLLSHSAKPNCVVKVVENPGCQPRVFIRTLMDIQKYQLLLWKYKDPRKEIRDANPWMDQAIPFSEQFHFIESMEHRFDATLNRPVYIATPVSTSASAVGGVGLSLPRPSATLPVEQQNPTENSSPVGPENAVVVPVASLAVVSQTASAELPMELSETAQQQPPPLVVQPSPEEPMTSQQCICSPNCTFPPKICQLQLQVRQKPAVPVSDEQIISGKGGHFDLMDIKCRVFEYGTLHASKRSKEGLLFCSFKIGSGAKVFHNYSIRQVRQTQVDDEVDVATRNSLSDTDLKNRDILRNLQGAHVVRLEDLYFEVTWNDSVTETLEIRHHIPGQAVWDPTKFDNLWESPKALTRKVPYSAIEFRDQPFMLCKANSRYALPKASTFAEVRSAGGGLSFLPKPPEFDLVAGESFNKTRKTSSSRLSAPSTPDVALNTSDGQSADTAGTSASANRKRVLDDDGNEAGNSVRNKKRLSLPNSSKVDPADGSEDMKDALGTGLVGSSDDIVRLQVAVTDYRLAVQERVRQRRAVAARKTVRKAKTTVNKKPRGKKTDAVQPHDVLTGAMGVNEEECALEENEQKGLLRIQQLQNDLTRQVTEQCLTADATYPTMEPNNPSQLVSAITAIVSHIVNQKLDGFEEKFGVSFDTYTRRFDDSCAASIAINIRKLLEEKVDKKFDELRTEFRNQFKCLLVALTGQDDFDKKRSKPKPIIESLAEILLKLCPTQTWDSHETQTTTPIKMTHEAQTSPIHTGARNTRETQTSPAAGPMSPYAAHAPQSVPCPSETEPRQVVPAHLEVTDSSASGGPTVTGSSHLTQSVRVTSQPRQQTPTNQTAPLESVLSTMLAVSVPQQSAQVSQSMASYHNQMAAQVSLTSHPQVSQMTPQRSHMTPQRSQMTPRHTQPMQSPSAFHQQMHQSVVQGVAGQYIQQAHAFQQTQQVTLANQATAIQQVNGAQLLIQPSPQQRLSQQQGPPSNAVAPGVPQGPHSNAVPPHFPQGPHSNAVPPHFPQGPHSNAVPPHFPQGPHNNALAPGIPQGPHSNALAPGFGVNGVGPPHAYQPPPQQMVPEAPYQHHQPAIPNNQMQLQMAQGGIPPHPQAQFSIQQLGAQQQPVAPPFTYAGQQMGPQHMQPPGQLPYVLPPAQGWNPLVDLTQQVPPKSSSRIQGGKLSRARRHQ